MLKRVSFLIEVVFKLGIYMSIITIHVVNELYTDIRLYFTILSYHNIISLLCKTCLQHWYIVINVFIYIQIGIILIKLSSSSISVNVMRILK